MESGETRPISLPANLRRVIWTPRWSPDGGKLLGAGPLGIWSVITVGDAPPHMSANVGYYLANFGGLPTSFDISRTEPSLVFALGSGVWVSGMNGESPRRVLEAGLSPVWSPDGQWIAYVRASPLGYKIGDAIEVVPAKGGHAKVLLSESKLPVASKFYSRRGCVLNWLPNGRLLFSVADDIYHNGAYSLWAVRVDARTAVACDEPVRLEKQADFLKDLTATANGKRLSVLKGNDHSDVYLAELDKGEGLSNPHRLTLDNRGNFLSGWTRDGQSVLFSSFRGGKQQAFRQGLTEPIPAILVQAPGMQGTPTATPDGRWILYKQWGPTQPNARPMGRLMRVPVSGGPAEKVLDLSDSSYFDYHCPSQSGDCVASRPGAEKGETVFYALDPVVGLGTQLARIYGISRSWGISPDGMHLAALYAGRIKVLKVGTGTWQSIFNGLGPEWGAFSSVAWSTDGSGFFVTSEQSYSTSVAHITTAGMPRVLLQDNLMRQFQLVVPSPDGRYLAFTASTVEANVWLLENF